MLNRRSTRFLMSLLVIFSMLLASCGGGNTGGNATPGAPGAADTPAGGEEPAMPTATAAMPVEEEPTEAMPEGEATEAMPTGEATEAGEMAETPEAGAETPEDEGPVAGDYEPWQGEQIGGTVTVLAIWGGEELDNFMAMIEPFQEQTGIEVQYEGTRDLGAVLNTRIAGGNPPDVAGLPNPGQLIALAEGGSLKPLDDVLDMEAMQSQYDEGFLNLASHNGQMYGIFTKAAVKSLVWYVPAQFEANGWEVPTTWDELDALEQQIIDMGQTPWCIGIDGGAGSGWPGTDWVEDFMLRTAGPEVYDQWWQHQIPWTDPAVKTAFETWGEIVTDETMVFGGPQTVVATNFGEAFVPMFEDEPSCYLHRQANFITSFFSEQFPDLVAGEDYNFFVLPPINEEFGNPLLTAGDLFGMFNDTPQARALMEYLVTPDAQSIWASRGGFLSANKLVDPSVYPDQLSQQLGEMLAEASATRFDASDLMPEGVNSVFSQAVLQYVSDPTQLDSILEQVEGTAVGQYEQQ